MSAQDKLRIDKLRVDKLRIDELRAAASTMLADLADLIAIESPSADIASTARCADRVAALGRRCTGQEPERLVVDGRPHLRWRFGAGPTRVVLIGHLDTVWPLGTLADWSFTVEGDRATGPGVVDMKAGLVMLFHALSTVDNLDGVAVIVNSDEEIGSPTSQVLIEQTARGAAAALVLEGSSGGKVKIARKGIAHYLVNVVGRASHAGIAPHLGINAGVELAHQVLAIAALAAAPAAPDGPGSSGGAGTLGGAGSSGGIAPAPTTVTPTTSWAGTTSNTVPARAQLSVDVRAFDPGELARVDAALHALRPVLSGAELVVETGPARPAMPASASAELFELARELAADIGLPPLLGEAVGGGSDGNLTAGIGVRTLDGLGAVGGNAHAEGEWIDLAALPERTALVAALVERLAASTA